MEAPLKLYISNNEKHFNEKCHSASTEKYVDNDIEYTRTDTFIEKACDWLEKNGCGYWLDDSALPNRDLIDKFRKYMEE